MKSKKTKNASMMALSLAALGVVFGDIGTSPLYAIREIFTINNNILDLNEANMLGILSLIFWSLMCSPSQMRLIASWIFPLGIFDLR